MAMGTNSNFPSQIVQTGCKAGGGVLFRAKSGRGVRLATDFSLVPTLILVELYLHDPMFLRGVYTDITTFTFNIPNRSECLLTCGLTGFDSATSNTKQQKNLSPHHIGILEAESHVSLKGPQRNYQYTVSHVHMQCPVLQCPAPQYPVLQCPVLKCLVLQCPAPLCPVLQCPVPYDLPLTVI
jgi:hypothetical protein